MIGIRPNRTAGQDTSTEPEWNPSAEVRGRAVGLMLMSIFGACWILVGVGVSRIHNPARLAIQAADVLIALNLLALGVRLFMDARQLARRTSAADEAPGRRSGRLFGLIFGAEILLIIVVIRILLTASLERLVLPAIAVVVGLHFLPLAAVFRVATYYITGGVLTMLGAIGIIGILITNAEVTWGAGVAFSVGLALFATTMVIASEARRMYVPNVSGS